LLFYNLVKNLYFRSLSFALLFAAAACSSTTATPTSPSSVGGSTSLTADQLAGTWQVQSIQAAGQAEQARPDNATYTLTFSADRFSTRADCNTCSGGFSITGGTISVAAAVACTRAACPTMAFETAYTGLLGGDHAIAVTSDSMVWTSSRGTLRFAR
jgi:heat shock protein HslJ